MGVARGGGRHRAVVDRDRPAGAEGGGELRAGVDRGVAPGGRAATPAIAEHEEEEGAPRRRVAGPKAHPRKPSDLGRS